MQATVIIYTLDDNRDDREMGRITLEDGRLSGDTPAAKRIILEPIHIGHDTIDPKKEPERFLRSLYLAMSGPYCKAMRAING